MPGAARNSKSSDSLLGAAAVCPSSSLPFPREGEQAALFPVKEDIYDFDYPELQELQKKLVNYLHEATPTSSRRKSAVALLRLVKLEMQERESCAFMLENILSVQNTSSSQDEGGSRAQNSADASVPEAPILTAAAGATMASAPPDDRKASLSADPSKALQQTHVHPLLGPEEFIVPTTSTCSRRQKSSFPSNPLFSRKDGLSLSVNSTVSSFGHVTPSPNPQLTSEGTLENSAASVASKAPATLLASDSLDSALPRSRVSTFAALEKRLFGEVSPPVPALPVPSPSSVPRCDAQVACVRPLKAVKRCRRKMCGTKIPVSKCGTQDIQKKARRKCSGEPLLEHKVQPSCSTERNPPKEKPHRPREKTIRKSDTLQSDSTHPCAPLAETHSTASRADSLEAAPSTAAQNEQQKSRKGSHELRKGVEREKLSSLEEPRITEEFKGQQKVEDICTASKAEASCECTREERTKLLGSPDRSGKQFPYNERMGLASREESTSSVLTTNAIKVDSNSSTCMNLGTASLPPTGTVREHRPLTPPETANPDISCNPTKAALSVSTRVKSVAQVETDEKNVGNCTATINPAAVEGAVPAEQLDLTSGEPAAKTFSHALQTSMLHENGRQLFLRSDLHSCTGPLQRIRAPRGSLDEHCGPDGTKTVRGGISLAKDFLNRREEVARQRCGSTGSTRKSALVRRKKEDTVARSSSTFRVVDAIEACVYHEMAHMSIRNSARGVIGDIDSIMETMSRKAVEQEPKSGANITESTAPATTSIVAPVVPDEATADIATSDGKTCALGVSSSFTVEKEPSEGEVPSKRCSNRTSSMLLKSASPSSKESIQSMSETVELPQFGGNTKRNTHVLVDDSNATMEKVYALLEGLDEPPSTENCTNRSTPPQRTSPIGCTAFGWRIQVGNEDDVDATCQTISIKKSQQSEDDGSCLLVEEGNSSSSRGAGKIRNREGGATRGSCSVIQESKSLNSPLHGRRHLSLALKRACFTSEGEAAAGEECGHKEDNSLLLNIQRQFPTLGDLLTESDKSKHASILREILINNGKCCADLSRPDDSAKKQEQKSSRKSECVNHCVTRFYKVEKNRPEVFSIVCRALKTEEGWEPLPEGQHWEYAWNLLWTWRPPRISYNKLLSFQKVNHFPEARQLTRKDKLKECIEKYQKLAGKRSEIFNIIPKTYCMPKEHTALFNDVCEAEGQKRRPIWICKPKDSSRGRGIYLAGSIGEIKYAENVLVQEYIANPMLLNGRKFDLRLYVLVTSFNPLEAFVYKQGFARVARVPFSLDPEHLGNRFMHLTNASVQTKWHDPSDSEEEGALKDVFDDDSPGRSVPGVNISEYEDERDLKEHRSLCGESSKLLLDDLRIRLEQSGIDWDTLWNRIISVILKSLSCCSDFIPFQPNSFELFGYDILIDADAKPWLIEVNSSPCMSQEYDIDRKIKPALIEDTIRLVNPVVYDRFKISNVCKCCVHTLKRIHNYMLYGEQESPKHLFKPGAYLSSPQSHVLQIIAGRLSEAGSVNEQNTSLVSPRRAYPSHLQTKATSGHCSCSPFNLTSNSSSTSSSTCRRGLLTHRPSRRATPDVRQRSEDWRKSRGRHVKQQHQQDLLALFNHTKPREYGEMPAVLGNYERIAPSKAWYQLQMLKHSLLGKHQ